MQNRKLLKNSFTMKDTPINHDVVSRLIAESQIPCIGKATIREVKKLINEIEKETGQKFVRMEMGVPGLPATQIGVDAEIQALKNGCAAIYPEIDGLPELKTEMARFVKLFMDVDVTPETVSRPWALCREVMLPS